jgi:hypothetical protein
MQATTAPNNGWHAPKEGKGGVTALLMVDGTLPHPLTVERKQRR